MKNLLLCIAVLSLTTVAYAQDKLTPGPGEVELTYVGKGTQLGVWNPTTKVYTIPIKYKEGPLAGQYRSLTFTDDGKVLNGEGKEVGSKQPDGSWKTEKMENVIRSSYNVVWNMEIVGNILETMVSILGTPMVQTSAPMDQDVLTFLVFCNHFGADQINKIRDVKKKQAAEEAQKRREENEHPQKSYTVYDSNDSSIGRIDKEGNIYFSVGRKVGKIDSNGVVYDDADKKIGKIDTDGTVTDSSGNKIGTVTKNGVISDGRGRMIGSITYLPYRYAGACYFFFFPSMIYNPR